MIPKKYWVGTALLLFVLLMPHALLAQSCALCYTQAAGAGSKFIQGLRSGILILIFPPMAISVAITGITWKRRNRFNEEPKEQTPSDLGW